VRDWSLVGVETEVGNNSIGNATLVNGVIP